MKSSPLIILLLCLLSSCSFQDRKPRLVASKGLPSELLLVVDDQVWQSDIADTLKAITQGAVPGLMQEEPFFKTVRISSRHYIQTYTTFHSKLFVHLDPTLRRPMIGISRDVVARPQIEVTVSAPAMESLRDFLSARAGFIRQIIADDQIEMRAGLLRKHSNPGIEQKMLSATGYGMKVPEQIRAAKVGKDFVWAGSNLNEKDLNVVLYVLPWDGRDINDEEMFLRNRDSVMRKNIPGSRQDQWMQTTRVDGNPVIFSRQRELDGGQVMEVRGLWEMRNGALGGPFVSLTRVDTASRKLIVTEGFVYSPSTDKRDLLRQTEASLRTLYKKDELKK